MNRSALLFCVGASLLGLASGCGMDGQAAQIDEQDVAAEEPVRAQTYLGTTYDQCSSVLKVLDRYGVLRTIQRGSWTRVDLFSNRFRWYCGTSDEYTTCPVGTRYVQVLHSSTSRQITWQCNY